MYASRSTETIEKWRPIALTNGAYAVSSYGRVKNVKTGRILKPSTDNGYHKLCVRIRRGVRKFCKVHRLVAEAFIPNPNGKPMINHKDSNRSNNNVWNLEWVTNAENIRHAFDNNRFPCRKGERHPKHIITESETVRIRREYAAENVSQETIGKRYGLSRSGVSMIVNRITWKHINDEN